MRAVFVPGTSVHDTGSTGTSARTIDSVRSGPSAPLRTVTETVVPVSPRTHDATSSIDAPSVRLPSTATITSSTAMSAFLAGLSSKTPVTLGMPASFGSIRTPIPSYEPDSESFRWARSSGVMKSVCPVSPTASVMPSMAP